MRRLVLLLALGVAACGGAAHPVGHAFLGGATPRFAAHSSAPRLSGAPVVGQTLFSSTGTWTNNPTSFAYQWQRCTTTCSNIAAATANAYTVASADAGDTLDAVVTASNAGGSASQTSAQTGVVTGGGGVAPVNRVQPFFTASTVSGGSCTAGCAIQGQQLAVTSGTWANTPTSFTYQWKACTTTAGTAGVLSDATGANGHRMSLPTSASCVNATGTGATTNTYTVAAGDAGKALAPIVTATNGAGSTSTILTGSCNTGLEGNVLVHNGTSAPNNNVANGIATCSPISAVAASTQAGEKFCTNAPDTCGFADISNTGVPAGTTLLNVPADCTSPAGPGGGCSATGSGWSYSSGEINVAAGGVLKDVRFVCGCATLSATSGVAIGVGAGATVEDSDLENYGVNSEVIQLSGDNNVTITNNNIHGIDDGNDNGSCDSAVRDQNNGVASPSDLVTITNNNIWFCSDPFNNYAFGGTVANNYMHGLGNSDNPNNHHEDIQLEDDRNRAVPNALNIRDNTMYNEFDNETAVLIMSNDTGGIENKRFISHNLIGGGGFCFYASGNGSTSTNITFTLNRWTPLFLDVCGGYGQDTAWANGTGDSWTSNLEDDNATVWNP